MNLQPTSKRELPPTPTSTPNIGIQPPNIPQLQLNTTTPLQFQSEEQPLLFLPGVIERGPLLRLPQQLQSYQQPDVSNSLQLPVQRPRSKTPDNQYLCEKLSTCSTKEELENKCDFAIGQTKQYLVQDRYKTYHLLEEEASKWLFTEKSDYAWIIYCKLDACIKSDSGEMDQEFLQRDNLQFEKDCANYFQKAKTTYNKNDLKAFILTYKEKAQEMLLLGRPAYALIIYEQLIACDCVNKKDDEVETFIKLIEGNENRKNVHHLTASWAKEENRTASLFAYALMILAQNGHKNLEWSVEMLVKAAKMDYMPAIQALAYLNKKYSVGFPEHLNTSDAQQLAAELASEVGFDTGFNLNLKKIYDIR